MGGYGRVVKQRAVGVQQLTYGSETIGYWQMGAGLLIACRYCWLLAIR